MKTATRARLLSIGLVMSSLLIATAHILLSGQSVSSVSDLLVLSPFSVFPPEEQNTVAALITIPIGILALVMIRQFIGVQTLGTFMPVLIGVAFRQTGPVEGILLFAIMLVVGIGFRFIFGNLQLLLVPRLAAVLTVVVLTMLGLSYLNQVFALGFSTSASLFPIVILTMTIERLVITWEESGARTSLTHLAGSLFVALIAYFCMTLTWIETTLFALPELLLGMLGVTIMIGRYVGFRLNEYIRFRSIATNR